MLNGERLKALRTDLGLSAEEVAQQLKMSQAQLSKYENGKIDPSTKNLARMATFYGVSADYLMGVDSNFNDLADPGISMGERLKALRQKRGLTASEAAQAMKMSQSQLLNYENGKAKPAWSALIRLVDFYGVGADYLLGISDDPSMWRLEADEAAIITAIRAADWPRAFSQLSQIMANG